MNKHIREYVVLRPLEGKAILSNQFPAGKRFEALKLVQTHFLGFLHSTEPLKSITTRRRNEV